MTSQILSLKQAIPYLHKYRGTRFVIKIGGSLLDKATDMVRIIEEISALHHMGIHVVVVHGGGQQLENLAKAMNVEQTKIAGRRVTSAKTLELAKMVFSGTINTDLVANLGAQKVPAVGLSGLDGALIVATKRPPVEQVDYGFVGDVTQVNIALIENLLSNQFMPVLACLAGDESGQVLNVNADTIACKIAVALKAEKYINMTNTPGILKNLGDPNSLLSYVDIQMLETLKHDGLLSGGMLPKAESCIAAIRGGVKRTHIINGQEADSLLKEVFTNEGCGTLIVERIEKNGN